MLPIIVFSIFELGSLNSTEKVIEGIYTKQLDAILFSVNQFSEDLTSKWVKEIDEITQSKTDNSSIELERSLNETPIFAISYLDSLEDSRVRIYHYNSASSAQSGFTVEKVQQDVRKLITGKANTLQKLFTYKKSGYRKIEPLKSFTFPNTTVLFFVSDDTTSNRIYAVFLNSVKFVRHSLAPKLQEIEENQFTLSVFDESANSIVYSREPTDSTKIQQKRNLWIIPDYNLGITLKGSSIEDVVRERIKFTYIVILVLVLVLIAGGILLLINIKREVELAQIKADFLSNVSHELRTPLALISMFAETLEMERVKTEEKKKEYYKIISQETARLSKIVNKILNFSKMEAGKIKYNFDICDLNEILIQISDVYSFHLKNNGFTFSFEYTDSKLKLNADKESLSEAIINLIDNAVKYSKERKEVIIKTGIDKEMAFVQVQDFGIGISREEQAKIFDKFYRVSTGNVHNTKGTGLGLALVKHIVTAHKGKIEINSQKGKGSTFKLLFPIVIENSGVNDAKNINS